MSLWILTLAFLVASTSTAHAEHTATLRVMSFNLRRGVTGDELFGPNGWWNSTDPRRDKVVRVIDDFIPDILGLQEPIEHQIVTLQDPSFRFAGVASVIPLDEILDDYGFYGVGRDDGVTAGEYAGIFYRADRFDQRASGTFWLSTTPDVPGTVFAGSGSIRIASWVRLFDRESNQEIFVLNTHWDNVSSSSRLQSAQLIRDKIDELSDGLPLIVTGDLNASETSSSYRELVGQNDPLEFRLIDSYREAFPTQLSNERTFHAFSGSTSGSRIDYVFSSEDFETLEASIVHTDFNGTYPSDHFPVTAILGIPVVVPEPVSWILATSGLIVLLTVRPRRRARTS